MRVLGLDPGATTGWCLYDDEQRRVLDCGRFAEHHDAGVLEALAPRADVVAIESVHKPHANIYPATVLSAITEGRLQQRVADLCGREPVLMTRHEAKVALTAATQRSIAVVDDKTVWAALVLLHGEGSDRKPKTRKGEVIDDGGPLGRVTSHERAALAVAVAWTLRAQEVPA